jgi:hypothetical protein
MILGLVAILAMGVFATCSYRVYEVIAPKHLTVENRTDHQVSIQIGTSYHLEVSPRSTGSLSTGWFPFTGYVEVESKRCDFDKTMQRPLIVDAAGAHCQDISDRTPFPTAVSP